MLMTLLLNIRDSFLRKHIYRSIEEQKIDRRSRELIYVGEWTPEYAQNLRKLLDARIVPNKHFIAAHEDVETVTQLLASEFKPQRRRKTA